MDIKETIKGLIDKSIDIKKNLVANEKFPLYTKLTGSDSEEWLADIRATVYLLKEDVLTKDIFTLTKCFNGSSDDKKFDKLVANLKSLYKIIDNYKIEALEENSVAKNKVFVVHGRNEKIRSSMFNFLRSIDVQPMEWNECKKLTGKGSPYIGEVLDTAFKVAQAVIVLLTPDDESKLRDEFVKDDDNVYEKELTPQARPNVLFEAGMALGRMESRTLIIQFGKLRPFSDIDGRHIIKFKGTSNDRLNLVHHLNSVGVETNIEGKTDWLNTGDFEL